MKRQWPGRIPSRLPLPGRDRRHRSRAAFRRSTGSSARRSSSPIAKAASTISSTSSQCDDLSRRSRSSAGSSIRRCGSWHQDVIEGRIERKTIAVVLLDEVGEEAWRWVVDGRLPGEMDRSGIGRGRQRGRGRERGFRSSRSDPAVIALNAIRVRRMRPRAALRLAWLGRARSAAARNARAFGPLALTFRRARDQRVASPPPVVRTVDNHLLVLSPRLSLTLALSRPTRTSLRRPRTKRGRYGSPGIYPGGSAGSLH